MKNVYLSIHAHDHEGNIKKKITIITTLMLIVLNYSNPKATGILMNVKEKLNNYICKDNYTIYPANKQYAHTSICDIVI